MKHQSEGVVYIKPGGFRALHVSSPIVQATEDIVIIYREILHFLEKNYLFMYPSLHKFQLVSFINASWQDRIQNRSYLNKHPDKILIVFPSITEAKAEISSIFHTSLVRIDVFSRRRSEETLVTSACWDRTFVSAILADQRKFKRNWPLYTARVCWTTGDGDGAAGATPRTAPSLSDKDLMKETHGVQRELDQISSWQKSQDSFNRLLYFTLHCRAEYLLCKLP